jgi:hypothetical protein
MMGAVGVAALLVGCSESSDVATGPRYGSSAPTTSSCNITQTKADARAYFPNSVQTAVQALIKTMGDQYGAGNTAGATNTAFDIMTYIANEHRAKAAANVDLLAQYGSNLTNDLIGCMAVGVTGTIDFTGALGLQGGYEVRGGSSDAGTPIGAVGKKSALQPPAVSTAGRTSWLGGRALFYGAPISTTPSFLTETPVSNRGYNWSTVPELHSLNGNGLVGICVAASDRDRIQKNDVLGTTILTVQDVQPLKDAGVLLCDTQLAAAPRAGLLPRLAGLAAQLFVPAPAYAAALGGGTGGTLNGLSDIGVMDAGHVNLTMPYINDALTTQPVDYVVTATGDNGTLLPDVSVILLISGNNGSYTPITDTVRTNAQGEAHFLKTIDKAGGYTLEAIANFTGYTQSTYITNLFHIKRP